MVGNIAIKPYHHFKVVLVLSFDEFGGVYGLVNADSRKGILEKAKVAEELVLVDRNKVDFVLRDGVWVNVVEELTVDRSRPELLNRLELDLDVGYYTHSS
jgi:hypothetical protein